MEDSKIIELYFRRSEQAIEETDKKYGNLCRSVANNILYNDQDTEECVSDTYLSAWNRIPPTKPRIFSVFLTTITRNLSIDRWRRNQTAKRGKGQLPLALHELSHLLPAHNDTEQEVMEKELTLLLNQFLRSLDTADRRVFICRYWYLDSVADISRQFGFTQNKVKSMLLRTRRKLKLFLEEKGGIDA